MNKLLSFLSLFGSLSTLLCCALPVTLVSLGMGAAFASLTANFPLIIWIVERKELLFITTAILLFFSFFMMKKSERLPCPIDSQQRNVCQTSKKISRKIYWITVFIYIVGLTFSYVIPLMMY